MTALTSPPLVASGSGVAQPTGQAANAAASGEESGLQYSLGLGVDEAGDSGVAGGFLDPAFALNRNAPVHRWVPWIAGYSRDFVADALRRFQTEPGTVLDPFAGVGTTLVEADLMGHEAVGFDINPYAVFAARTKLRAHRMDPVHLRRIARDFRAFMREAEHCSTLPKTSPPAGFRTRSEFYSPKVKRKVLHAIDFFETLDEPFVAVFRLAFAASMVEYSNYSYEPSLGRKAAVGRPDVEDYPVGEALAQRIRQMADDVAWYRAHRVKPGRADGRVMNASFFDSFQCVECESIDLIITSPPYLNNYHYNRNTRPQLYWLNFCESPRDLRHLESLNFGTYWQNARDEEHIELDATIGDSRIHEVIDDLRTKNPDKGLYGGHGWANYAARYFNDCVRFVDAMAWCLRPGAAALVVLGNSILQGVPIPTDRFFASIAAERDLDSVAVNTPRHVRVGSSIVDSSVRVGKSNGQRLYESVVELRKP